MLLRISLDACKTTYNITTSEDAIKYLIVKQPYPTKTRI